VIETASTTEVKACGRIVGRAMRLASQFRVATRSKSALRVDWASDVLLREAEAALYALRDIMRKHRPAAQPVGPSTQGPLDPRVPRAETDAVGCPRAVAMLLNQLANGPSRVAEHHGRGRRYASSRLPSFRLLGRGVFRRLSTARS